MATVPPTFMNTNRNTHMDRHDDDFDFDDDGFDDLPDDALQELEFTAIRATQAQPAPFNAPVESNYGEEDEDELIDLRDQNGIPRQQSWANAPSQPSRARFDHVYAHNDYAQDNPSQNDSMDIDEQQPRRSQVDPQQLLLRVKKLEQEKARLNRDLQSEKSNAQKTAGEAATLRRRLNTVAREHDQSVRELRQSNDDALKKHRDEIQRLKQQNEQVQTNVMFAEHDKMADKATRVQKSHVSIRPKQHPVMSPSNTPKRRQKSISAQGGFGDGFGDEDMALASPSKTRAKSKPATPRQANKRKRNVTDQSPIPALQLSEPRQRANAASPFEPNEKGEAILRTNLQREDHRFQLLQRLVNNRSSNGKDRVLEAMTKYAFPSEPGKQLSSIVYDDLLACSLEHDVRTLAIKICHIFLSLWERSLDEAYYEPIFLYLDALHFILACEPSSTAVAICDTVVPLIMKSVDLVSIPIADAGLYGSVDELFSPAQRKITASIDALDCLDLLYAIVSACVSSPEAITHVWQLISFDFILVIVRSRQPLPTVQTMLRILSTSALPTSLGAIHPPATSPSHEQIISERQERRENELLERLTSMLDASLSTIPDPTTSPSQSPTSTHTYTPSQTLTFRLQVINLLTHFSILPHGTHRLLTNPLLLPRLITFLHAQLSTLYSAPTSPTHALTTKTLNTTFTLIYNLITSHPHTAAANKPPSSSPHDYSTFINERLALVPGGHHKFLVTLTRIAFSEGLVIEQGIDDAVVKGAEDLLDGWLTGPEGEQLLEVFEPGGTGDSGSLSVRH
ncbi:hypothetical protein BU24DRAFT_399888 [Aaosphaeria arxii CBS 175.79]|uniref:DNA repair protein Rad26 n=1 Tax=Aaosphaeria arxii CBS 175.79 TaxID=1450172 RepID=A0A6A5XCJ2_9PLEO|nr:uncharacterized protein BU24DRAFT_399888 [Aaosphaeria arxii CBS 175.79]KAF2010494.1 hypothetical protein BU24DRAFT_399888 [Aaosphaeria arxii CBS 175.79]